MPAAHIEIISAKGTLRCAAQAQFMKLDPKGELHTKRLGELLGGVALRAAGHAVIDLGQQHD